ncbi:uncharacterized protein B0H18DRAFT_125990 [Fomitopsis serialis]|uniref:uncharacterized protein n=1 Tax=Fomitopsis serialis TaxID=139415 RepID=UPI0020076850|nr:uncharacterized protein B0H18DRAFT_125990 [Neoantrodia serialis]KAH9914456.1 hypothetical protein B0H18DRAFT_125990 [Neoantrodia serialis]
MATNTTGPGVLDDSQRYEHPFTLQGDWEARHVPNSPLKKHVPRTLIEYRMCALSAAIRDKPDWHIKFHDETIREKWKKEIREQQVQMHPCLQLTENMINYIFGELEAYASLRDPETGIQPGPYERIWQSDQVIPASLRAAVISAAAALESVPDDKKDWHPGSDEKVLDLVHPSLYPVIYGRTVSNASGIPLVPRPSSVKKMFISERFQWLPSDFDVADDGTVTLASPYINNIHPEDHKPLMDVIPKVLEKAVPMFEWVLSELARQHQLPTRLDYGGKGLLGCIWAGGREPQPDDKAMQVIYSKAGVLYDVVWKPWVAERDRWQDAAYARWKEEHPNDDVEYEAPEYEPFPDRGYFSRSYGKWLDTLPHTWPDSKPAYEDGLVTVKKTVGLKGRRLQVIVKLANIVLTPEKPQYGGGTWHVEGMDNEAIVSTFIYYYDCENTTESTLSFRTATQEPDYHNQYDYYCLKHLYGIDSDELCVQVVGRAVTKEHRCLAFPNIYQHLVSPFHLKDKSKPGHRKILVFFLVDPNIKVPSTSDIGPQQEGWIRAALESTQLWQRLPSELRESVLERLGAVTEEQAKKYREELMKERTACLQTVDGQRFGNLFNLCEH